MNPFVEGVHDSIIRLFIPAHIVCIRHAKMKRIPMKDSYEHANIAKRIANSWIKAKVATHDSLLAQIESYVSETYRHLTEEIQKKWIAIFNDMTKWQGIDPAIFDDVLRVLWLFHTIDNLKIKTDQYPEKISQHGIVPSYTKPNSTLKISVSAADILDLAPAGPKFLCLSNLKTDVHSHQVVLPAQRGSQIELSIDAGSYSELKLLSIFPFGKFRSVVGNLGTDYGISSYDSYRTGAATYSPNQENGIIPDNIFNNTGIDTHVGSNNFVVEDLEKLIIGIRVAYSSLHGLVFPSAGGFQQADTRGYGVFTSSVINQMTDLSESRRRVLAAMSWLEGSFDSINTYDHANRLSWGISHWISNYGNTVDGELTHVLAYLYKEHPRIFDIAFGDHGFSVWFDPDRIATYGLGKNGHLPFSRQTILFPECHGDNLRNALLSRRTAPWRTRRSIHSAWVFRKAGLYPEVQRGQIEMLNYRMSVFCPAGQPSEREVATATSISINPNDQLDRESRIDACITAKNILLSNLPGSFQG